MKLLRILLAMMLVLASITAVAEPVAPAPAFADLHAFAPEGTFLPAGEAPQITENSYKSPDISITITEQRVHDSDVHIADIYLASVASLRRAFSHDQWNRQAQKLDVLTQNNNAILAMTGDYSNLFSKGIAVANGEVIRKTDNNIRDNCLIYYDGTMVTHKRGQVKVKEMMEDALWQTFLFGPSLLKADGTAYDSFTSNIGVANPRSILGYYGPGHFAFILVDGRTRSSRGIALTPLSEYMQELGLKAAYNLDGGQSAQLWFNGRLVNRPYKSGRALTDIVLIAEAVAP